MNFKSLALVLLMAASWSVFAKPPVADSWRSYVDGDVGISINMPSAWDKTDNKSFGKVFGYGNSFRAVDGRAIAQGCAVVVSEAPSSRGKENSVIDREIDAAIQSTPPSKLGKMMGVDGVIEASSIAIAGRRALRVISVRMDEVSGIEMKIVQTTVLQSGKAYGVNCYATSPDFSGAWPVFEAVASSFRFLTNRK